MAKSMKILDHDHLGIDYGDGPSFFWKGLTLDIMLWLLGQTESLTRGVHSSLKVFSGAEVRSLDFLRSNLGKAYDLFFMNRHCHAETGSN